MLFLYSHECVSEGWGYWWLLTDIYLLHPRKLSVVGSSVLYMYIREITHLKYHYLSLQVSH